MLTSGCCQCNGHLQQQPPRNRPAAAARPTRDLRHPRHWCCKGSTAHKQLTTCAAAQAAAAGAASSPGSASPSNYAPPATRTPAKGDGDGHERSPAALECQHEFAPLASADVLIIDATNLACLAAHDAKRWRRSAAAGAAIAGDSGSGRGRSSNGSGSVHSRGGGGGSGSAASSSTNATEAVSGPRLGLEACFESWLEFAASLVQARAVVAVFDAPRGGKQQQQQQQQQRIKGEGTAYLQRRGRRRDAARDLEGAAAAAGRAGGATDQSRGGPGGSSSGREGGGQQRRHLEVVAARHAALVAQALPGAEADDAIAALCGIFYGAGADSRSSAGAHGSAGGDQAEQQQQQQQGRQQQQRLSVVVATADGDAQQLVRGGAGGAGGVRWLQLHPMPPAAVPLGARVVDEPWVTREHGVPPEALGDLLAMTGKREASIGGVGLGERSARKLLRAFGSIDGVRAAARKGKLKGFSADVAAVFGAEDNPRSNPRLRRLLANRRALRLDPDPGASLAPAAQRAAGDLASCLRQDTAAAAAATTTAARECARQPSLPPPPPTSSSPSSSSSPSAATTTTTTTTTTDNAAANGSGVIGAAAWLHPGHRGRAALNAAAVEAVCGALRRAGLRHQAWFVAGAAAPSTAGERHQQPQQQHQQQEQEHQQQQQQHRVTMGLPVDIAVWLPDSPSDGVGGAASLPSTHGAAANNEAGSSIGGSQPLAVVVCSAADLVLDAAAPPAAQLADYGHCSSDDDLSAQDSAAAPAATVAPATPATATCSEEESPRNRAVWLARVSPKHLAPFLRAHVAHLRRAGLSVAILTPAHALMLEDLAASGDNCGDCESAEAVAQQQRRVAALLRAAAVVPSAAY